MLTLTPKHASGSLRSWAARGEVGTGSPQKMRPLKDNQSECRSIGTECSRGQQMPACKAGALPSAPAIAFGTGRPLHSSDRLSADALPRELEAIRRLRY